MQRIEKWTDTYHRLLQADREQPLQPRDLESLALAAYLTGRDAESFQILERAHLDYLSAKKIVKAIRCAFWLGLMLMNAGERARSSGWMSRGERLLGEEQIPGCAEKGLFLIPAALGAFHAGQMEEAKKLFEQAATIGEKYNDGDLTALGWLGQGQAMVLHGEVAKGIKLLDETMVAVETNGEMFPVIKGIIYCAVIEICRKVWDLRRAREWTSALTRWCDAQPGIVPFRGQCLVRRAEIRQFHGDWQEALEEISDACVLLMRFPAELLIGEAYYRKAELLRLMGNFEEAEAGYHEASKRGRKPQPGLALLRLAQRQEEAAEISIRNALKETTDTKKRSELLPSVVLIMIAVKQTSEAHDATKELCAIAKELDAPYLYAISSHCLGAVFLAEGNVQPALEHLEKALKGWNALGLPYESARTRELKGLAYRKMNDKDSSETQLAAAKWIFEQLGAYPDKERINQLLNRKQYHETHNLTLRELQVILLVATGKTNRSIAGELFISERTVDRHVSNIFSKLNLSSRVEVTAFALKNKILEHKE